MKPRRWAVAGLALAAAAVIGYVALPRDDVPPASTADAAAAVDADLAARGAYLARAGNCAGCHTARGGAPYAGGRALPTPFGTVYGSNLTPDVETGIGRWSAAEFRRALHEGRSRDGRPLVPAFPYDSFTRIVDADADALFAFLRSLPAVRQANRPHLLRFPFGEPWALAAWRALYFRPGHFEPDPARPADWNRGAYLVRGLGHCSACHAERNRFGAAVDADALRGGLMPLQNWYAPALGPAPGAADAAGLARLLGRGRTDQAALLGPMAEVVLHGTQHLDEADLRAMARYLATLPAVAQRVPTGDAPEPPVLARGERLYAEHCADCHGARGEGRAGAYLPLAGNPEVLRDPPANLVQVLLGGAFAPSTRANPRPFGMPPFAQVLSDADAAAVLSYVRNAWGQRAAAVTPLDIERYRSGLRP